MALVVQCNRPDYELGMDFFSSLNCRVKTFSCETEIFPDFPTAISLILFHYHKNNPGFLKVIEALKRTKPDIPIIMTSSYRDENMALWALRSRIWDIVKLPHELPLLRESIKKLIDITKYKNKNSMQLEAGYGQTIDATDKTEIARKYIESHFAERIKVEELAGLCHMSPTTFLRYFKKENGITVREYLKKHRIFHARHLLLSTHISVKEIALSSGYSDISLFNRIFKAHMGSTPSEYRKSIKDGYLLKV